MSHLTREALARLVDEPPTNIEAEHLAECVDCTVELQEMRGMAAGLRGLPSEIEPKDDGWVALRAALEGERLIAPALHERRDWSWAVRRIAAALVLFLGGGAAGFAAYPRVAGSPAVVAAAAPLPTTTTAAPRSAEQAAERLRAAEDQYRQAMQDYAVLTGSEYGVDPVARLAALEGIVLTTRAALNEAPADPVINGYHLTATAQREAMIRQIAANSTNDWY